MVVNMFCSFNCIASMAMKIICCLLFPLLVCYKYLIASKLKVVNSEISLETSQEQISKPLPSSLENSFDMAHYSTVIEDYLNKQGLDKQTVTQLRTKYAKEYKKDLAQRVSAWPAVRPLKGPLLEQLVFLCNYIGIANTPAFYSFAEDTYAIATDDALYINQTQLKRLPAAAQLFVLAHELGHCFFKDDSLGFIADLKIRTTHSIESAQHPVNALHRLQEVRADQFALQKSPLFAFGATQFNKYMLKSFHGKDTPGITHPKHIKRLEMAENALFSCQKGQLQLI